MGKKVNNTTYLRNIPDILYSDKDNPTPSPLQQVGTILSIGEKLRTFLPSLIQKQCMLVNIIQNTAIFYTESPAWTTKVKYYEPQILACLNDNLGLKQIDSIQVRSRPLQSPSKKQALPRPKLSEKSAALITSLAKDINNVQLKQALLKLVAIQGQRSNKRC